MILYMDTETYSSVDLKACGVGAYAAAPDAEVILTVRDLGYKLCDAC